MYNVVCHCNFLHYSSLVYLRKNLHNETPKHLNFNSYSRYHTKQVKLLVVVVSMFELVQEDDYVYTGFKYRQIWLVWCRRLIEDGWVTVFEINCR
jgi:hypothetical protein